MPKARQNMRLQSYSAHVSPTLGYKKVNHNLDNSSDAMPLCKRGKAEREQE